MPAARVDRRPAWSLEMNTRLLIPLLLAGAVALACGSLSHSDASAVAVKIPAKHATKSKSKDSAQDAPQINTAFAVSAQPGAVLFNLSVANAGRKSVELAFPSGQQYDFAVVDAKGREVYRWGKGRMFTQSVQNRNIDGGDTMQIRETAEAKLPRGAYVAVATLASSNFPVQQRVPFELR